MAEVLDHLLAEGVEGRRIAVQLHGEPLPGFVESLRAGGRRGRGGARLPLDAARGHRAGGPAARRRARGRRGRADLHQRPRGGEPAPTGPSERGLLRRAAARCCAVPWSRSASGRSRRCRCRRWTCHTVQPRTLPARPARAAAWQASCRRGRARLPVAGHRLEIRGHAVLVDGDLRPRAAGRDGPAAGAGAQAGLGRARGPSCCARCPAAATTSTPSRRRWPGCVRRWAPRS